MKCKLCHFKIRNFDLIEISWVSNNFPSKRFFLYTTSYLNVNSVSDKICSFNELNAIKIMYKMSPEVKV